MKSLQRDQTPGIIRGKSEFSASSARGEGGFSGESETAIHETPTAGCNRATPRMQAEKEKPQRRRAKKKRNTLVA